MLKWRVGDKMNIWKELDIFRPGNENENVGSSCKYPQIPKLQECYTNI